MRVFHRYLGFFLAGIMAVYALSGVVLIFRKTDLFHRINTVTRVLESEVALEELGQQIDLKGLEITRLEDGIAYFKEGTYNTETREVVYTTKELPYVLDKITYLHKATISRPLAFLNIFFGLSLLFFVISSFWMFAPGSSIFKKGLYFALAGLAFALLLIFV